MSIRVMVTGPESSGTRLTSHILALAGADIFHYTPRRFRDDRFLDGEDFDWVVLVIRSGHANAHSMVENGHAYDTRDGRQDDLALAYEMVPDAILNILAQIKDLKKVRLITYEALVYEPGSRRALLEDLGLPRVEVDVEVGSANAKYYGGEFFRDTRSLEERAS